jgi:hypothetical protein
MKRLFLFLVFCGLSFFSAAQVIQPSISGRQESDFAFEVKTIDEFLERFNNDQYTLIRQHLETRFPGKKI